MEVCLQRPLTKRHDRILSCRLVAAQIQATHRKYESLLHAKGAEIDRLRADIAQLAAALAAVRPYVPPAFVTRLSIAAATATAGAPESAAAGPAALSPRTTQPEDSLRGEGAPVRPAAGPLSAPPGPVSSGQAFVGGTLDAWAAQPMQPPPTVLVHGASAASTSSARALPALSPSGSTSNAAAPPPPPPSVADAATAAYTPPPPTPPAPTTAPLPPPAGLRPYEVLLAEANRTLGAVALFAGDALSGTGAPAGMLRRGVPGSAKASGGGRLAPGVGAAMPAGGRGGAAAGARSGGAVQPPRR